MLFFQDKHPYNKYNDNYLSPDSKKSKKFKIFNSNTKPDITETVSSYTKDKHDYSPFVIKSGFYSTFNTKSNNLTERKRRKTNNKIYSPSPNTAKTDKLSDRFIPMNKGINLMEKFNLAKRFDEQIDENFNSSNLDSNDMESNLKYELMLQQNVLNENINTSVFNQNFNPQNSNEEGVIFKSKIFSFKQETKPKLNFFDSLMNCAIQNDNTNTQNLRKINPKPYKILSAPNLMDDFYLNLLDWSSRNDIAVGLGNTVGLWSTNQTQESILCSYENELNKYVSSVIFCDSGEQIAVGTSNGQVEIYDGKL